MPHIYPTRIQMKNPPTGIISLSERKLRNSKKLIPPSVKSLLKESDAIQPKINIAKDEIMTAASLDNSNFADSHDTITSSREIDEVIAAKNTRIKNIAATILPPAIFEKTTGSV